MPQRNNIIVGSDQTEEQWRELDGQVNEYPGQRTFKAIGSGGQEFVVSAARAARVSSMVLGVVCGRRVESVTGGNSKLPGAAGRGAATAGPSRKTGGTVTRLCFVLFVRCSPAGRNGGLRGEGGGPAARGVRVAARLGKGQLHQRHALGLGGEPRPGGRGRLGGWAGAVACIPAGSSAAARVVGPLLRQPPLPTQLPRQLRRRSSRSTGS